MLLQEYLNEKEIKPAQFADKIGVPASTVSRLLKGQRKPGLELLQRISKGTEGRVQAYDFFASLPSRKASIDGVAA